jgi:N-acetylglucosamine-1-phosphodiester alpha-N-acetylglucosaminidase
LFLARSLSGRLYLAPSDKLTVSDDYDRTPYPKESGQPFAYWEVEGTVSSTGRSYTAHVAVLSKALPSSFSYALPPGGCCHATKTSLTAKAHDCKYATNAGYFDVDIGSCIGNIIINSTAIELPATARANFGVMADSFISGYLTNSTILTLGLTNLISGAGWIVRRGMSYVNQSVKEEEINESFVTLKAPRTVIGAHGNGSLFLVQVDGIEDLKEGLDLYEMADILISMGMSQAVNLDGGGSSVSVYEGEVVSRPTCIDTPVICERPVTTITCMY